MSLSVVIIGAGNMAYHLSKSFHGADVTIAQIYNRSAAGLQDIKDVTSVDTTTELRSIHKGADIYLIAVRDDAISDVCASLRSTIPEQSIVAHTSGSTSINVLTRHFQYSGAFYPLQSIRKGRDMSFAEVPIFITSDDGMVASKLTQLALSISHKAIPISDKDRSLLHVPAVIVNNFVNHLYTLASDFCVSEDLPFEHLIPLMEETLNRIKDGVHPSTLQTGPAIRMDRETIARHRHSLKDYDQLSKVYNYLTKQIQDYHR